MLFTAFYAQLLNMLPHLFCSSQAIICTVLENPGTNSQFEQGIGGLRPGSGSSLAGQAFI